MEKTTNFNLIIIDESGSMSPLAKATVAGCNETLNVARSLQKKNEDTQRTFVSIYAFQSDSDIPSRYIVRNMPVDDVKDITEEDYHPYGCTPLYDAVGTCLSQLKEVAETHEDSHAIVTIITDGYENSSRRYNAADIRRMIMQLKELGWTFNFIGANVDVDEVAEDLAIDNRMSFDASEEGTEAMYENFSKCMEFEEINRINSERNMSHDDRISFRKSRNGKFFEDF